MTCVIVTLPLAVGLAFPGLVGGESGVRTDRNPIGSDTLTEGGTQAVRGSIEPRSDGPTSAAVAPKRQGAAQSGSTTRWSAGSARVWRVLRWRDVPAADRYWFQLYRVGLPGSRKVFEAWPRTPSVTLPVLWTHAGRTHRLSAGRYRWYVWAQRKGARGADAEAPSSAGVLVVGGGR